jgi:hypothetical protein
VNVRYTIESEYSPNIFLNGAFLDHEGVPPIVDN